MDGSAAIPAGSRLASRQFVLEQAVDNPKIKIKTIILFKTHLNELSHLLKITLRV
jgi:hypothetical protein